MNKHLLFIHGGGEGGYEADAALVASLQAALGSEYTISYPEMESDESAPDFGWPGYIGIKISESIDGVILAAHSLGASMLLKYLSENPTGKKIAGIFLMATPFWNGDEDWQAGLKLRENFADQLPGTPIFFYHCRDDEEVPFSHLDDYKQKLPQATFCELGSGGHQFNNDLTVVADDIKSL